MFSFFSLSPGHQFPNLISHWKSFKLSDDYQCSQCPRPNCILHLEHEPYAGQHDFGCGVSIFGIKNWDEFCCLKVTRFTGFFFKVGVAEVSKIGPIFIRGSKIKAFKKCEILIQYSFKENFFFIKFTHFGHLCLAPFQRDT